MTEKPGYFSGFGGAFIPEILASTFAELEVAFEAVKKDPSFWAEYEALMRSYSCPEMQVELVNDGPVTIWLDSAEL